MKFSRTLTLIIGIFIGANLAAFNLSAQADPEVKGTIGPFTFHESTVVMWIFGEFTVEEGVVTVGDAIGAFCESVTVNGGCIGAYEITANDIVDATNGFYGLMPVYGDDPGTAEKDGAGDGDLVTFKYYSQVNATGQSGVFNVDPMYTIPFASGPGTELNLRDIMLPVELSAFNATFDNKTSQVTLKWRTESEVNNLGFDVYRSESSDGQFVKVNPAYIKGVGTDATPHDYMFVDESAVVGKTYYYYLETISFSGERNRSHILKVLIDVSGKVKVTGLMQPITFALLQNFPNPFNPETWIPFHLAKDADVTIRIFDIRGQEVRTIHLGQMPAGQYATKGKAVFWDGRDSYGQEVSSGIYFYSLTAGTFNATKKLTIIK